MASLTGFDANAVEPQDSFDPIPAAWYTCMITDSEMKPTKNNQGEYLQLRLDVIDGDYKNRVLFDRLNLSNPNKTTEEIAQRQLSAICRAVGVMTPNDSADLHDRPIKVKVTIRPASNGYDATNEVKAYASSDSTAAPTDSAAPAARANKKPWE